MWLILVTFNTIGYGDITPETLWGRIFLVVACIWGTSIYSILVVTLQNMTIFQSEDMEVYKNIVIDADKEKLKKKSGKFIRALILYIHLKKKDQ